MYQLRSRPAAVEAFLLARRPAGLTTAGSGDSTQSGVVTSIFVTYSPVTLPDSIYTAELNLTFTAARGGTLLRVDSPAEGAGPDTDTFQIVFGPAHGAPGVIVSPSGCLDVGVRVGGRAATSLYPAAPLLSAATRVMRQR